MKVVLNRDLTVKDICDGFVYNEYEGKEELRTFIMTTRIILDMYHLG
jgi:hypothetical protein